jgi:hypothetical protein
LADLPAAGLLVRNGVKLTQAMPSSASTSSPSARRRRRCRGARLAALRADLVLVSDWQQLDQSAIRRAGPVLVGGIVQTGDGPARI